MTLYLVCLTSIATVHGRHHRTQPRRRTQRAHARTKSEESPLTDRIDHDYAEFLVQ
jgi:hypothetical protein